MKILLSLLFFFSLKSFGALSSKKQHHGFLKHKKEEQAFDKKRKRGFKQYKENYWLYQRKQRETLKTQLKRNRRKPTRTIPEKKKWEREQTLWNLKQEKSRRAYLKERNLLRNREKKHLRPQSLPYNPPDSAKAELLKY